MRANKHCGDRIVNTAHALQGILWGLRVQRANLYESFLQIEAEILILTTVERRTKTDALASSD
jgi:hypothetical protein